MRIDELLEDNRPKPVKLRFTAKKIWYIIVSEGYNISYTSVKRVVRRWKSRNTLIHDIYIEQVPKIGKRAEFDWGYTPLIINGVKGKYPTAFMVLNKSLYRYARVFEKETSLELVQSHIDFFNEIGGVPTDLFYDNLKIVVDDFRTKKINERFLEFTSFYGFTPMTCNPVSPNEKGTDEETVGFVRNWCFSERNEFECIKQANEYLREKLHQINFSHVYKRDLPPAEGLTEERRYLKVLPTAVYNNYTITKRMISNYSTVMFERNHYSVSEECKARSILLKVYTDKIEMVDSQSVVAVHKRLYGREQYSIQIEHYLSTLRRKPGALEGSRAFLTLSEMLRTLYNKYYSKNVRDFIDILFLLKSYEQRRITGAMEKLFGYGIIPTYEALKNILEQKPDPQYEEFEYPSFKIETGDPGIYDSLVEGACHE
jgi:transposase